MAESRDTIKSRMLRTVADMWDYPGVENEAAYDPLVALLINACAAELAKINREKKVSQARLVEEVARLLIPDAKSKAVPAHAIVTAAPTNAKGHVNEKEEFLYKEQEMGNDEVQQYFSPTARYSLIDAEIKYQASGNNISKIVDHKYKNVMGYTKSNISLPSSTLYLGIDINEKINSANEISFFFNLLNTRRKDFFFNHLQNSNWYLGSRALDKHDGYSTDIDEEDNLENLLTNRFQTNTKTCKEVNRFYQRQFITIKNLSEIHEAKQALPQTINNAFDEEILNDVEDNLLWLRVEFPKVVSANLLDDVFCFTNCFPVLNRQMHDTMYRLQDSLNIIPLKTDDFFFDVKKIIGSDDEKYHLYDRDIQSPKEQKNSVLLRTSGVGRFGAFEAKEELQYLLETLKDETASYAAIGTEDIEGIVSEINVQLGELEEKVLGMDAKETISYLAMRNTNNIDGLFIEFWTTAGKQANDISAGNHLDVMGKSNIKPNGTLFITPTVGGRNRLSEEEKLTSFKRTMLTNNRLVTHEDIKAFCREQLGNRIRKVEIKKGLTNGINNKSGLRRTVDICLSSQETVQTSSKEWDFLLDDLLTKINHRVAHSFPYRIVLDTKVEKIK